MKVKINRLVVVAAILVGLVVAGVSLKNFYSDGPAQEDSVVRVGTILPQTGSAANIGEWCRNGMEIGLREVNEGGGINGRQLQVVYEDSQNDPKTGISAFRKLVSVDKVPLVVVAMSGVANGVLPVADESEVVLFATVVSLPNFPQRSEWAFRYHISGGQEARKMAEFAGRQLSDKQVAVLYINDEFGHSTAVEFESAFKANGGRIVTSEGFEKDAQDFRSVLTRVKAIRPAGVYVIGYDKAYALLLKQMGEMRFDSRLFTNSGLEIPAWRSLVGDAAEGAYYTAPLYNTGQVTQTQSRFTEAYRERHGDAPPYVAAECYDVVRLIATAARRQDGRTSRALRDALAGVGSLELSMGEVSVKDRDVVFPLAVMQIRDGQPVRAEE